jgi:2'-aminobiphenyl-2,3-diol 1,2-dioxygenase, large subunit
MGQIVGGFATSHVLMSPDGVDAQAERVFAGMKEIGRRLRTTRPDILVIVASDHLLNFKLDLQVPFIVVTSDELVPFGDMDIPQTPFRGHRAFAEAFLAHAAGSGFDLAKAEDVRPDHGVAIPNAVMNLEGRIPVVLLYVNTAMWPAPAPARVWKLGNVLRDFIETARPENERVAVLATGGLSHWICMPGQGNVNEDFDRSVIETLAAGDGHRLAQLTAERILAEAGNGGLEVLNWICMAGALPGCRGERVYYEPIRPWLTGMGGLALDAGAAR